MIRRTGAWLIAAICGATLAQSTPTTPDLLRERIRDRAAEIERTRASIELLDLFATQVEDHVRIISLPGWDLALLYGVTTQDQRDVVSEHAREIIRVAERAIALSDEIIENSAQRAAFGQDGDTDGERARQRAIQMAGVHLPLRMARAELLLGFSTSDMESRSAHAERVSALIEDVEVVSDWSEATRLLLSGLAERLGGRDDRGESESESAHGVARRSRDVAIAAQVGGEAVLARAIARSEQNDASGARTAMQQAGETTPFIGGDGPDPFWQLALADTWLRVGCAEASRLESGERRASAYARALALHEELASSRDMRDRAVGRVSCICTSRLPYGSLPGIAVAGWLERVGRDAPEVDLLPLLEQTLERTDLAAHWQSDAAYAGALLLRDADRCDESTAWMLRAAALTDDRDESYTMLLAAARHAIESTRGTPACGTTPVAIVALEAVDASSMPSAQSDPWRLWLGRMLIDRYTSGSDGAQKVDMLQASSVLGRIDAGSETSIEASALAALGWLRALRLAQGPEAAGLSETERFQATFAAEQLLAALDHVDTTGAIAAAESASMRAHGLVALSRYQDALDAFGTNRPVNLDGMAAKYRALSALDRLDALPAFVEELSAWQGSAAALVRTISEEVWSSVQPHTLVMLDVDPTVDPALGDTMAALHAYCEQHWDAATLIQADRLGWARLLSGEAEAAARVFTDLVESGGAREEWMLGLGEAAFRSGDAATAFDAFRRVSESAQSAGRYERAYWHSWVRMLEILAKRGGHEDRISREVERLAWLESADEFSEYLERARGLVD